MADDRMIRGLEEQLRHSHATNAELRERVADSEKSPKAADARAAEANVEFQQVEKLSLSLKQAENLAKASQRKREEAEQEALKLRGENVGLRTRLGNLQAEVDRLHALDDRISAARHSADLFAV
jgi:hypothetical protein